MSEMNLFGSGWLRRTRIDAPITSPFYKKLAIENRSISRGYDPVETPREIRLLVDHSPCYQRYVEKRKDTIWTAPASQDVPALVQLDMRAPIAGVSAARKRAADAKVRAKTALGYYVARSSAESLRKLVK